MLAYSLECNGKTAKPTPAGKRLRNQREPVAKVNGRASADTPKEPAGSPAKLLQLLAWPGKGGVLFAGEEKLRGADSVVGLDRH
jgi:hypothetical protein